MAMVEAVSRRSEASAELSPADRESKERIDQAWDAEQRKRDAVWARELDSRLRGPADARPQQIRPQQIRPQPPRQPVRSPLWQLVSEIAGLRRALNNDRRA